jgi:hypothetical protein
LYAEGVDPLSISIYAAGRLLYGELSAADVIIENLPAQPIILDHGAGYCKFTPLKVLRAALPLPEELKDVNTWLSGSQVQADLRAWLNEHRDELKWDEKGGVYYEDGIELPPAANRRI